MRVCECLGGVRRGWSFDVVYVCVCGEDCQGGAQVTEAGGAEGAGVLEGGRGGGDFSVGVGFHMVLDFI